MECIEIEATQYYCMPQLIQSISHLNGVVNDPKVYMQFIPVQFILKYQLETVGKQLT